ncbi:unnamed protein product, partial [Ectocarpus sp. 8 AP-2014]
GRTCIYSSSPQTSTHIMHDVQRNIIVIDVLYAACRWTCATRCEQGVNRRRRKLVTKTIYMTRQTPPPRTNYCCCCCCCCCCCLHTKNRSGLLHLNNPAVRVRCAPLHERWAGGGPQKQSTIKQMKHET